MREDFIKLERKLDQSTRHGLLKLINVSGLITVEEINSFLKEQRIPEYESRTYFEYLKKHPRIDKDNGTYKFK